MRKLYPNIEPYQTHRLQVSDIHNIFIEECGNPNGEPVVFLHGGPGGGLEKSYRRYFNPEKFRIILFDQRGSGQSTPHACLEENTTWDLVSDIEKIRELLNIKTWHVFGGSWGSTLALSYAIKHTDKVKSLILRGIFTIRQSEIDWYYESGASYIYPEAFEKYLEPIDSSQNNFVSQYYEILTDDNNKSKQLEAAKAWSIWEGSTSKLLPSDLLKNHFGQDKFALAFARIECHYFYNKGFFDYDGWILDQAQILEEKKIKGFIVQGRYDMPCPVKTAWDLHKIWPSADFKIIDDAGHSASEKGIIDALVEATDSLV